MVRIAVAPFMWVFVPGNSPGATAWDSSAASASVLRVNVAPGTFGSARGLSPVLHMLIISTDSIPSGLTSVNVVPSVFGISPFLVLCSLSAIFYGCVVPTGVGARGTMGVRGVIFAGVHTGFGWSLPAVFYAVGFVLVGTGVAVRGFCNSFLGFVLLCGGIGRLVRTRFRTLWPRCRAARWRRHRSCQGTQGSTTYHGLWIQWICHFLYQVRRRGCALGPCHFWHGRPIYFWTLRFYGSCVCPFGGVYANEWF